MVNCTGNCTLANTEYGTIEQMYNTLNISNIELFTFFTNS